MKKIVVIYFILVFCQFSLAQNLISSDISDYELTLKNTPFIFEGEVIKITEFFGKDIYHKRDSVGYSSNIIRITRVFRGAKSLKPGTIEIITLCYTNPQIEYSDGGNQCYHVGFKGMFFCKEANNIPNLNISTGNALKLIPYTPFTDATLISVCL